MGIKRDLPNLPLESSAHPLSEIDILKLEIARFAEAQARDAQ